MAYQPNNTNEANIVTKTIAFDGSAGNGAIGAVNLFTVTGLVARYLRHCL